MPDTRKNRYLYPWYKERVFLFEEEIMFHLQYLDFRLFHECESFKICYVMIDMIASNSSSSYIFDYFFRALGGIKIKIGQVLVQLMANIFSLLLPKLRRPKTFRRFYDFDKMIV